MLPTLQRPKQAAAMIAAGKDPVIQKAQIAFVNKLITKQLGKSIQLNGTDSAGKPSKNTIQLKDIMTSEYGAGLLADRTINAGARGAYDQAESALETYIRKHHLDPNDVDSWAAQAPFPPEIFTSI